MAYALGKFSYGVCDRCGFRTLVFKNAEWSGQALKFVQNVTSLSSPQLEPPHTI